MNKVDIEFDVKKAGCCSLQNVLESMKKQQLTRAQHFVERLK